MGHPDNDSAGLSERYLDIYFFQNEFLFQMTTLDYVYINSNNERYLLLLLLFVFVCVCVCVVCVCVFMCVCGWVRVLFRFPFLVIRAWLHLNL